MFQIAKGVKRIITIILLTVVLTTIVFFSSYKKVQALPIVAGGAIIAGLVSFMAAAGIEITTSGVESGDLGTIWENITHDFSYDNKALTDWYGDGDAVNFIVGKDNVDKFAIYSSSFASWLNELKDWLVNTFSVGSSISSIYNNSGYVLADGTLFNKVYLQSEISNLSQGIFDIPLAYNSSKVFDFGNNNILSFSLTSDNVSNDHTFRCYVIENGEILSSNTSNYLRGNATNQNVFIISDNPYSVGASYIVRWGGDFNWTGNQINVYGLNNFFDSLEVSSISVSGELTDGYDDFEQALEDAFTDAGTGENARIGVNVGDVAVDLPLTDQKLVDGVLDLSASNTLTGELTGGYVDEKEAEKELDGTVVPSVGNFEGNIIKVDGIEDFFPFCIPFDLYAIISKLNVPAVAPRFTYTFDFNGVFESVDIDIDFSIFEQVARVARIAMIIAFSVFLIIKTRDLIKG